MNRGSPNPKLAHSVQRGSTTPCFHWLAASSHEAIWNAMSWPEAVPRKKKGVTTARDTKTDSSAAELHSRIAWLALDVLWERGESLICCSCDCNRNTNLFATPSSRCLTFA